MLAEAVLWLPALRFAEVAARFDTLVARYNFQQAAQDLLSRWVRGVEITGLENLPSSGPLLILANHPGMCDGLSIIASVPRPDLKVVISGIPFTEELKHAKPHFILSPPPSEAHARMGTVRKMIHHLDQGGSLLLFPTGNVDPDPAYLPGAEAALERWSASLEILLRKAPHAQVLIAIVSGVLAPESLRTPLRKILGHVQVQKVAQFSQVVGQMLNPERYTPLPRISFGQPLKIADLEHTIPMVAPEERPRYLPALIALARSRLQEHLQTYSAVLENLERIQLLQPQSLPMERQRESRGA
jgi:1-acyl-sn-glycerol-3-phosphate acyltransferase